MTILYADDDKDDQELFVEIMANVNPAAAVILAEDGLKALEILASGQKPDIIFLDAIMPFMDGHQTLAEIRKHAQFRNTRIFIFSTHKPPDHDYTPLNAEYIRKPGTLREAMETLKAVMADGRSKTPEVPDND